MRLKVLCTMEVRVTYRNVPWRTEEFDERVGNDVEGKSMKAVKMPGDSVNGHFSWGNTGNCQLACT